MMIYSEHCREKRAGIVSITQLESDLQNLAERVGFEPTVHLSAYTHLAGEHLQPLGHLSAVY